MIVSGGFKDFVISWRFATGRKSRKKALKRLAAKEIEKEVQSTEPFLEAEKIHPAKAMQKNAVFENSKIKFSFGEILIYLAALLPYLLFKFYSASPVAGDENIYFYIGSRVGAGVIPYREILFAHPPGHMLISVILMLPGWFNPFFAKFASILPAMLALLLSIYLIRLAGFGRFVSVLCGVLLALSQNYLAISTHFTGANWSMFIMVSAIWALMTNRKILAGVLLAFSALVSFHILPAILGILAAYLLFERTKAIKTLLVTLGVTFAVHLLCLIIFGDPYVNQVFGYHLAKSAMVRGGFTAVIRFLFNEYHLATFCLLAAILWVYRMISAALKGNFKPDGNMLIWISLSACLAQIFGVLAVNRVFTYYMMPLLPLFVFCAAYFFEHSKNYLRDSLKLVQHKKQFRVRVYVIVLTLIFTVSCFVIGEKLESQIGYYKREYDKEINYTFRDSKLMPNFVNRIVERLFFSSKRRIGDIETGISRYLWQQSVKENPESMLPILKSYDSIPGTIFGDASTTGYFALMSSRKITFELADTNAQLFKSGQIKMTELISRLEKSPPAFVVLNPARGIARHPHFAYYIQRDYKKVGDVKTSKKKRLQLFIFNRK